MKKVDAILTSDWHLRLDKPTCRTDNFQETLFGKVAYIKNLQAKYNCPVLHAGDLFHHWKTSPFLETLTILNLPDNFNTVYGQHELPQHNFGLREKSGTNVLGTAGKLNVLEGTHFGFTPEKASIVIKGRSVLLWHVFVWDGKKVPWPQCDELTSKEILKKYKQFDLIVTGDHHRPFTDSFKGRLLVNPGCLSRQDASYFHHEPRVYLYNAKSNSVSPHYIPIKEATKVISRDHIENKRKKDKRIQAFIERLNDYSVSLSFENNLDSFFKNNIVRKEIKNLTFKAVDNEKEE